MRRGALMLAEAKMTDKEIAIQLDVSLGTLRQWKKSPLFLEMVRTFAERITEGALQTITEQIMSDAPANLSFLKDVRDGRWQDDPKRMAIRLKAGETLFDRQAPKQQHGIEDAVKVVIGAQLLGQMARAFRNDGGTIDADFEEISQIKGPLTPDELAAREQAAELTEDEDEAE